MVVLNSCQRPYIAEAGEFGIRQQVADAKFEYRTNSHLDTSELMSILSRFFLSVIPM